MSADEKVWEWHVRKMCVGLGQPPLAVLTVNNGTDIGCRRRHIENLHAPTAYAVGDGPRVCVSNANLVEEMQRQNTGGGRHDAEQDPNNSVQIID
jgi:hypothetical protein